jgi:membrane protein
MRFVPSPRSFVGLLVETGRRIGRHRVVEMSAALAYYSALSLAPLLVITMGVAGLLADRDALETEVVMQADQVLGHGTADLVRKLAVEQRETGKGTVATVAGIVALLLGASAVFGQLQDGLTRVFEGPLRRQSSNIWLYVRHRVISVAMVASLGFLLLVSMLLSAILSALAKRLAISSTEALFGILANVAASVLVAALLFSLVFRVLPDTRVRWREAWAGGTLAAVLFHVGEWAIGRYLGRASVGSTYGAAGTLVVLLVWVYYSALIVFASAEFTHVVATRNQPRTTEQAAHPARSARRPKSRGRPAHATRWERASMVRRRHQARPATCYDRARPLRRSSPCGCRWRCGPARRPAC